MAQLRVGADIPFHWQIDAVMQLSDLKATFEIFQSPFTRRPLEKTRTPRNTQILGGRDAGRALLFLIFAWQARLLACRRVVSLIVLTSDYACFRFSSRAKLAVILSFTIGRMLLSSKVAAVTGSARGIGRAVAQLFAQHGAHLLLLDRDPHGNAETAAGFRPETRFLSQQLDICDRPALDAAFCQAAREIGPIDILINNAGVYPRQGFLGMTAQQWDDMQDINLKSMFHTCQAVLPDMVKRRAGKIINISSVTFYIGVPNLTHYVASKGGVIGFTRALAREFGPHNIHINSITPGAIDVEAEKDFVSPSDIQVFLENQSLKRRMTPLDIARTCLFLGCELSDGLTGQSLNVDGGWIMH
jgi:3-oxoacyl-[acyl-carrier protein] reductase